MKFVVDCMLGKLAKWLKILGFDTQFFSKVEDDKLISLAEEENRILLTRDNGLLEKSKNIRTLFIESEDWRAQLVQVLDAFNLRVKARPYSLCIECNTRLKELPKAKAKNMVSDFIYETAQDFALCPDCGRVYWQGTHHTDMALKIEELLKLDDSFNK